MTTHDTAPHITERQRQTTGHGSLARRLACVILIMSLVPLALLFLICRNEIVQRVRQQQDALLTGRSWALAETTGKGLSCRLATLRLLAQLRADTRQPVADLFQSGGVREEGFAGLALLTPNAKPVEFAGISPHGDPDGVTGTTGEIPDWFKTAQLRGRALAGPFDKLFVLAVALDHGPEKGSVLAATVPPDLLAGTAIYQHTQQYLIMGGRTVPVSEEGQIVALNLSGMGMNGLDEVLDRQNRPWRFAFARSAQFPVAAVAAMPAAVLDDELDEHLLTLHVVAGVSVILVALAGVWLAFSLASRMRDAERNREQAFREMEHSQKLSSIGRLATGVAHEINNPLAIINEKAGLMKDLAQAATDFSKAERFTQLAESILQSVARCRAITHRLLGFARRMEVQTVELDLSEVIREVLGFLEREALYRQVKIELELDAELPSIETDRGQMQQVFLNLLNNALAAVDDGGAIRVRTWQVDDFHVAARVMDNGHGMSRETMNHIFEPFFSTKGDKGSGLGLSITHGIVSRLGGHIQVESEPDKGTSFTVILPRTVIESNREEHR